jgi:hypothetical protein
MLGRERSKQCPIMLHEAEAETKWFGREKGCLSFLYLS